MTSTPGSFMVHIAVESGGRVGSGGLAGLAAGEVSHEVGWGKGHAPNKPLGNRPKLAKTPI